MRASERMMGMRMVWAELAALPATCVPVPGAYRTRSGCQSVWPRPGRCRLIRSDPIILFSAGGSDVFFRHRSINERSRRSPRSL